MFETIVFDIAAFKDHCCQENWQESLVLSKTKLEAVGISCLDLACHIQELDEFLKERQMDKKQVLFVSNCPANLEHAKNLQFFCLGYLDNNQFFPVEYCFEDFSSLDKEYITKLWCRYNKSPLRICTSRHIFLQELSTEDIPALFQLYQEEAIRKYMAPEPVNFEDFSQKYKAYINTIYPFYDFGMWGVYEKSTNRLIGLCGFHAETIQNKEEISIGFFLSSQFTKHGLGKEMVRAALRYAKRQLFFTRIVAKIDATNQVSQKFIETCNFQLETSFAEGTRSYLLYTYQPPLRQGREPKDHITNQVYEKFQQNPDTRVYGKRYKHQNSLSKNTHK